ncbi:MAG: SurA N-terminal domain-containing protein [Fimbriimonadaceae bacterium]
MIKNNFPTLAVGVAIGGALVFLVTSMGGCGKKGDDVVAVVNGQKITKEEFYKYMELKPDVRVRTANGPASLPIDGYLGFQALQDLIAQKATLQLAIDKKMEPSGADINAEIEFQKKVRPGFLTQLTDRGLTLEMIKQNIKIDLIQERLLTEGITVKMSQVEQYIKDHPKEFIEAERADLEWILVSDMPTRQKVDQDLTTLQFSQVAVKYSKAPNAKQLSGKLVDGNTGQAPAISALPKDIADAVKKTGEGTSTGWITLADGWARIKVIKRIPARPVTLDDTRKEFLRRAMARDQGSAQRDINKTILQKLRDSDIKVELPSYQDDWKKAFEQFKVENKLEDLTGSRGQ